MHLSRMNLIAFLLVALVPAANAQEEAPAGTPVRVEIVFSKHQGEKVSARLPYSFIVNAGGDQTYLRMGIEVPVTVAGDGTTQYRNVGTNLDCSARPLSDGRFQVDVTLEQSSMYPGEPAVSGERNPLFRTFSANFGVVLKDGETVELTSATDPLSGEVSKVDLSLKVLK